MLSENNSRSVVQWRALIDESLDPVALPQRLEKQFDLAASRRQWWLPAVELRSEAERNSAPVERFEAINGEIMGQLREIIRSVYRATGCETTTKLDYIVLVVHIHSWSAVRA